MTVVLALGALLLAGLALLRPTAALLTLAVLDVTNLNGVIEANTGVGPFKAEVAVALLAVVSLAYRRRLKLSWSPVHLGLLILFAGFCISFLTTADLATSMGVLSERGNGLLFYAILFVLALSTDRAASLAKWAVVGLGLLAALTVVQEYVFHNSTDFAGLSTVPLVQEGGALTPRHAGTESDVNFWARLLTLFLPIALAFLASARRFRALLWAGLALALALGIYLTQSRGGFIAALLAVVLWCLLAGPRTRKALLALPVILLLANPILGFSSRLATLGGVAQSTQFADQSVVTRERFQLDALRMFAESPVTGHGIGSYPVLFDQYDKASNFFTPVTIAPAAHNFYLEQLADGGVILMLAWLLFFGSIFFVAIRTMLLSRAPGDRTQRLLAIGIIAGLAGWMAASAFLHLSDFRALLLVAVVAAVVDIRARATAPAVDVLRAEPSPRPRRLAPVLASIALVSLIAAPVVWALAPTRYAVTSLFAVLRVDEPMDGNSAYALDVVSRGHIPATFAETVSSELTIGSLGGDPDDPAQSVEVVQSRLGGGVQIVTTASTPDEAARLGAGAATVAVDSVAGLDSGYRLQGTTSAPVRAGSHARWLAVGLAGIGAVLAVVAWCVRLGRLRESAPVPESAESERRAMMWNAQLPR